MSNPPTRGEVIAWLLVVYVGSPNITIEVRLLGAV